MLALTERAMSWNQPPAKPVSARAAQNAKALRRVLTEPEERLWWHLRNRLPLDDTHFRRQVPIGSYVADFCCLGAKLIVEVDGGQHTTDEAAAYDTRRTTYLASQGFSVLRFSNADVMQNMNVVLDTIHAALVRTTPTPYPSPQGGGELET
ncbi:endonuclease domain-containing protein [Microvirga roseola]|uniref:endonuclease domain-containing protein n=1 Tax=Microvirga roseola TaxID=2883126 RepID=UPI002AC366C4|nr:endonuclease domain-containing protein [Microvirga roseola]